MSVLSNTREVINVISKNVVASKYSVEDDNLSYLVKVLLELYPSHIATLNSFWLIGHMRGKKSYKMGVDQREHRIFSETYDQQLSDLLSKMRETKNFLEPKLASFLK